jgi:hypothetical protein
VPSAGTTATPSDGGAPAPAAENTSTGDVTAAPAPAGAQAVPPPAVNVGPSSASGPPGAPGATASNAPSAAVPPAVPNGVTGEGPGNLTAYRPFTKAELSLGALTLPRAEFSLPTQESTKRADLTLLLTLRQLFQWNPRFAVGAAVDWGLRPVTDQIVIESARGPIRRSHSRNYFMITGLVRYIPLLKPEYELWVQGSGGALIVSDRYQSELDKAAIPVVVGPQATTIGTEGGTAGVGLGFEYRLDRHWAVGGFTQQMLWFLPKAQRCAQTLECSTVGGRLFSFELGLNVTYRTRL